jgi:type I restriction enzyme, S subunit
MVGEWKRTSLREAGVTLIDCDHRTPPAADAGYPYVAIPQLKEGRLALTAARRISPEHFADWTRKAKPQHHDVILSRRCNPGETAFVPAGLECALGQNLVLLRSDGAKVFPPFLRWLLNGPDWWEQVGTFINVGAIFNSLKCADIPNFKMRLPPLAEQKAIAAALGALDDKIELNRRMNATLEAMARALFQSWFVDFDPVRAKLDGRSPAALDPATAALFPEHLEETAFGHTPKGWEVRSLDKIAHYLNGLALQKYPPGDGPTLPVIKIAQLRKGDSIGADRCNTALPINYIVQDGDVLFSWSGSLEVELWCGGPGALNQHLFKVTSPEFPKWFYYLWTLYHLDEFRLIAADKATTMGHIQRGHLAAAKVLVPARPLLDAMTRTMSPLIDQLIANRIQSRTLATLRDTLLPKLLSGEIMTSNPEPTKTL